MSDVDDLVAALVRDSDRLRLPPASALRTAGDVRARRQAIIVAGAALTVLAVLGGAGLALATPGPHSAPAASQPPSAPVLPASPTAQLSPDASPTTAPPTSPTTTPSPVACSAADLTFVHSGQDAGMGSAFITFVVRNGGAFGCQLRGAPHLQADGVPVPSTYAAGGDTVLVPSGGQASFQIREVNGYGGYATDSPACAHPVTYHHLAVVLADGSALPLGDGEIFVQCGGIDTAVWTLAS